MGAGGWVHGWLMVDGQMGWWMDGGMAGGVDGDGWGMDGQEDGCCRESCGAKTKAGLPHQNLLSFPPFSAVFRVPLTRTLAFSRTLYHPLGALLLSVILLRCRRSRTALVLTRAVLCISPCHSAGDTEAPLHRLVGRGRQRRGQGGAEREWPRTGPSPRLLPWPASPHSAETPGTQLRLPGPPSTSQPSPAPLRAP